MRRVGTISSAAGLIFLGIWMIINRLNPELGREIFKWWPAIIIFLGVEILIQFARKDEETKPGFNFIIIPVIIIFIIVNVTQSLIYNFNIGFRNFGRDFTIDNIVKFAEETDIDNYKIIQTNKLLQPYGSKIYFSANNVKLIIKKSTDNNIRVDAKIYVSKTEPKNSYAINEKREQDGYNIAMTESYVKKVEVDLYVPSQYNYDIKADNLDIKSDDSQPVILGSLDIKCDNANVRLKNASDLILDAGNSNVNTVDIKNVKIKGNNCNTNIDGNSENISIQANNGRTSISNKICRNVNISLDNGMIDIRTEDRNISVDARLDQGTCRVDNERRVNSGITKVIGNGQGKVDVSVDHGTIYIGSQE